jgi:hypothetical protein
MTCATMRSLYLRALSTYTIYIYIHTCFLLIKLSHCTHTGVTFPVPTDSTTTATNTIANNNVVVVTVNGVTVSEEISLTAGSVAGSVSGSVPQECSVKLPSEISAGAVVEVALLIAAEPSAHRYYMFNYMNLYVFIAFVA